MKTIKRLVLILSISIFLVNTAQSQTIIELIQNPPNATSLDNIIIVSENLFTSGPCWIDSSNITKNGYDIVCNSYFSVGMLAVMCTSFDTFQLGQLSDGNYQFHFNLYLSNDPQIKDSTTIVFSVGSVGLSDNNTKYSASVFPNPTSGKIFVNTKDISGEGELVFSVYSLQGKELRRIVLNASKSEFQVDLSELASGYYLYDYHFKGTKKHSSGKLEITKP